MNWGYNPPRDAGKKNGNHQNISQNLKKTRHTPELHPKNNNKSPKIPQDPPKSPKIPSKSPQNPPVHHGFLVLTPPGDAHRGAEPGSIRGGRGIHRFFIFHEAVHVLPPCRGFLWRGEAPKRKVKRGGKMEKSPGKTEKTMENPRKFTRKNWKNHGKLTNFMGNNMERIN
jgi:hypothetical protein